MYCKLGVNVISLISKNKKTNILFCSTAEGTENGKRGERETERERPLLIPLEEEEI